MNALVAARACRFDTTEWATMHTFCHWLFCFDQSISANLARRSFQSSFFIRSAPRPPRARSTVE